MIAGSNDYCNLADASDFASRRVDCRTTNRPAAGVPITSDTDTTLLRYCCQRLFDKHGLKLSKLCNIVYYEIDICIQSLVYAITLMLHMILDNLKNCLNNAKNNLRTIILFIYSVIFECF